MAERHTLLESIEWGRAMCEALGLDQHLVMEVSITSSPMQPLRITVVLRPEQIDIEKALRLAKDALKYKHTVVEQVETFAE